MQKAAGEDGASQRVLLSWLFNPLPDTGSVARSQYRGLTKKPGTSLLRVACSLPPGGATGIRTPDLLRAKQPLSQLSYRPKRKRESRRFDSLWWA